MPIIDIIVSYAAMITPALTAVLAVVVLLVKGFGEIRAHLKQFKDEVDTIKDNDEFKKANQHLAELIRENQELTKCNRLLLDQITKIQDYVDNIKKENRL